MAKKPENIMRIKSLPDGKVVEIHEDGSETPYLEPPIDWDRIDAMSDEDIAQQVMDNPDAAALPLAIDVRGIRENLGFNKKQFARLLRVPYGTLLNWEYGRNEPSGAARVLFKVLEKRPNAVFESLGVICKGAQNEESPKKEIKSTNNAEDDEFQIQETWTIPLKPTESQISWETFPSKEVAKRGVLRKYFGSKLDKDIDLACKKLCEELGLTGSNKPLLAYRRGAGLGSDPGLTTGLLAWLASVLVNFPRAKKFPIFQPEKLNDTWFQSLRRLTVLETGPLKAVGFLREAGIALMIERHFKHTKLDGASFIYRGTPVVGLTLRYDRIDNFWFVMFHELAHIKLHLLGGSKKVFLDNFDAEMTGIEKEADDFAQEALIPSEAWEKCPARTFHSEQFLKDFAKNQEVHPAIVAGRIMREENDRRIFPKSVGQGEVRRLFETSN